MPNSLVEGLFVLAFWLPPAVVVASALTLLVKRSAPRTAPMGAPRPAAVHH